MNIYTPTNMHQKYIPEIEKPNKCVQLSSCPPNFTPVLKGHPSKSSKPKDRKGNFSEAGKGHMNFGKNRKYLQLQSLRF